MKNPDPPADKPSARAGAMDALATQQIDIVDLDDFDISAEPVSSRVPPKMPPLPAMPPSPSLPPAAPSRSPMFYVGILVGVLVVSAAIGTVVALSRRKAAPTTSGAAAPKVITIGTVEMDDNPDSGP